MMSSFLNMLFLTFAFSILPTSRCSKCLNIIVCISKAYLTVSLSSLTSFLYHDHCSHLHYHPLSSASCPISTNCSLFNLFPAFSPRGKEQLRAGVRECLELSRSGDCSTGKNGPIGMWDVSDVTDIRYLFYRKSFFTANISKCGI